MPEEPPPDETPAKPCCARMLAIGRITWCFLDEGHDGMHAAMAPRDLPTNTFTPKGKR